MQEQNFVGLCLEFAAGQRKLRGLLERGLSAEQTRLRMAVGAGRGVRGENDEEFGGMICCGGLEEVSLHVPN